MLKLQFLYILFLKRHSKNEHGIDSNIGVKEKKTLLPQQEVVVVSFFKGMLVLTSCQISKIMAQGNNLFQICCRRFGMSPKTTYANFSK